MLTEVRDMF